jgi:acylphosphatase
VDRGRRHLVVSGRVQGVYFRWSCREVAGRLGLAGWVRNRPDGSVEVVAEGDESALAELVAWCGHGPPDAHVTDVEEHVEAARGEVGFEIRR